MKRFLAVVLAIFIVLEKPVGVLADEAPKETELYAKSAVLMDGDSGRILYEKDGHSAMANASTTKILTCILALETCDLDSQVTVSSVAASQPKVHLGMRAGQSFLLKDLLYGLMLESYNDCAVAIAEFVAGSTGEFAKLMNDKAAEIGCEDSYFITPNGLDAKDEQGFHHTTAADLAKIMRYCIIISEKAEQFLEITRTSSYGFADLEGTSSYQCNNHNAFLQMMEGALSGKTGFTGTAGYCYVGALRREGKTYIVALLACGWPNNKTYKWSDTKKLMNYGITNFYKKNVTELAPDNDRLKAIPVNDGQGTQIGEKVCVNLQVKPYEGHEELLLREDEEITLNYEIVQSLQAPVRAGDYLGKITYVLGNEELGTCNVVARESVEKIDLYWCFLRILDFFFE